MSIYSQIPTAIIKASSTKNHSGLKANCATNQDKPVKLQSEIKSFKRPLAPHIRASHDEIRSLAPDESVDQNKSPDENNSTNQNDRDHKDSPYHQTKTSDAFVQTETLDRPETISRGCQTELSFIHVDALYEEYRNQLKAQSLTENFKPMYSLSSGLMGPPLKIGLTLPRGVKRKVFYPDDPDD